MSSPPPSKTTTNTSITHHGPFNSTSRATPALAFFEKYNAAVTSRSFSTPYHTWFAPSATFSANDGTNHAGGAAIWAWMQGDLFGAYEQLEARDLISTVIVGGHEKGDRIVQQQTMVFWFAGEEGDGGRLRGDGVPVRRTIEFVSGPSEVQGQGTDGLQYFVGKTFWDTDVLTRERARRLGL